MSSACPFSSSAVVPPVEAPRASVSGSTFSSKSSAGRAMTSFSRCRCVASNVSSSPYNYIVSTSGGKKGGGRRTLAQDQKRKIEQRITASPKGNQAPVGIFFKLAPKNNPSTYIYVVSPILEGKKQEGGRTKTNRMKKATATKMGRCLSLTMAIARIEVVTIRTPETASP